LIRRLVAKLKALQHTSVALNKGIYSFSRENWEIVCLPLILLEI